MFLGHYAIGMAAKKVAPQINLGLLTGAAVGLDLIWPFFVLGGIEWFEITPGITAVNPLEFSHYPWSHSLVAALCWSLLLFLATHIGFRWPVRVAMIPAALVASHWFLDLIVHRPDLPLWPSGPVMGFGIWNAVTLTIILELAFLGAGLWIYLRARPPQTLLQKISLAALLVTLVVLYAGSVWGPAPPSMQVVAISALGQWLFVTWAGLSDRRKAAPMSIPH